MAIGRKLELGVYYHFGLDEIIIIKSVQDFLMFIESEPRRMKLELVNGHQVEFYDQERENVAFFDEGEDPVYLGEF